MKRFLNVVRACFVASLLIIPVFAVFNTAGIAGDVKLRDKYPPSWYQILPADKRFVLVMNDEAVLDKETGLVWERSPSTYKFNWVEAIYTANNKIIGSRKGWRLPAVEELATLVDPSQQSPSIPASSPFIDIQSDMYWSASVYTLAPAGIAQGVHFTDGTVANVANKSNTYYIWCVRGGYGYNN